MVNQRRMMRLDSTRIVKRNLLDRANWKHGKKMMIGLLLLLHDEDQS